MQRATAEKLRKEWDIGFCHHPMLDNEYELKTATGNLVCLICGRTFSIIEMTVNIYFPLIVKVCLINNSLEIIKFIIEDL